MSQEISYLIKQYGQDIAIRLHTSGDFYSLPYLNAWRTIAARFPSVFFYGYTKSWVMAENNGGLIDRNLVLIPSEGGKDDHLLGNRPRAYVYPAKGTIRSGTIDGSKDDLENVRQYLKGKSIGLRAHGAKKGYVK
jgi:hypothetical protein